MSDSNPPDNSYAFLWRFFRLDTRAGKLLFFPLALAGLAFYFKLIPYPFANTEDCGGRATIVGTLLNDKTRTPLANVTVHLATFAKDETDAHGAFSVEGVELPESKIISLRVEFPGGKQVEVEGIDLRNTVKYPVKDCKVDLGQILGFPENTKPSGTAPTTPSEAPDGKSKTDHGHTEQPRPPPSAFFNDENPVEIALLTGGQPGELSVSNLKNSLVNQWQSEGLSVSTALFRPGFYARFAGSLENEDLAALKSSGLGSRAACLCFLKIRNVRTGKESHETGGDTQGFEKAGGDLEVKFYALRAGTSRAFTISETGSGGNRNRALESLNDKFVTQLFNHKLPLALCKN